MSVAGRRSNRGDEYQLAVALHWAIRLIADDELDFIQVDAVDMPDELELVAVDDVVVVRKDGGRRLIQAKKNQPDRKEWSLSDSVLKDELLKAREQLEGHCASVVEFVSRTPFGKLEKLVEEVRDYSGYQAFSNNAPNTLTEPLATLAALWQRTPEASFALVKRIEIGPHHTLDDWERLNREHLEQRFVDGALSLAVLERVIRASQSSLRDVPSTLTRKSLLDALAKEGLYPAPDYSEQTILEAFASASAIGRNWSRTIAGEGIPRPELDELNGWIEHGESGAILLTDGPGTGKTCVLLDLVEHIENSPQLGLLFIKGDRFSECETEHDLAQAGLPEDIVGMVSRLADKRRVVVVLDSLDVLSIQRDHGSLRLFMRLLDRLETLRNVTIVVACRSFDLDYDPQLSGREWGRKLVLQPLDFEQVVAPLLERHGIRHEAFGEALRQLLSVPQNLRLFVDVAGKAHGADDALGITTPHQLHDRYLDEMILKQADLGREAMALLESMAERMLQRRRMSVARVELQSQEQLVRRLLSQGVLIEAGAGALQYSHQTLLDTLAVRSAMSRGLDLPRFILEYPPFPFVRPIVRNYVLYLRAHLPDEFSRQIRSTLDNAEIAYHLKRAVVETFAELVPDDEDLRLVRHLTRLHPDLLHRLLWRAKAREWFPFLYHQWWPTLVSPGDDELRRQLIFQTDRWMNDFPEEVVALWRAALGAAWGDNSQIKWQVAIDLKNFTHWHIDGVVELLTGLYESNPDDPDFIGGAISRYVDETGEGGELLWRFIAGMVTEEGISRHDIGQKLRVDTHHFCRKEFLPELLARSDVFLTRVLQDIEGWSEAVVRTYDIDGLNDSFLSHTTWEDAHSARDTKHYDELSILFELLEKELKARALARDEWWLTNEPALRRSNELAIRYILFLAYRQDIEGNVEGITEQLQVRELFRYSSLEYEVGELANLSYPYIAPSVQDEHQRMVLSIYDGEEWGDEGMPPWAYQRIYDQLCWIPAPYRRPEALAFIAQWRGVFGEMRVGPDIRGGGGIVVAPLTVAAFMELTDEAALALLVHYEDYTGWGEDIEGAIVGNRDQVRSLLSDAASCDPLRYLRLYPRLLNETAYSRYLNSIIEGCAYHLNYRFGNTQPQNNWAPLEPLPGGEGIAATLLDLLERYPVIWEQEWSVARALEGCAHVVSDESAVERLIWLLLRMLRVRGPEVERVRFNQHKREVPEGRDLLSDALNEPRGIAAGAATILAKRLLEKEVALPELLVPLLHHFCRDSVASVRAAVIRHLPYLLYKSPELGWQLMDDMFREPQTALWELSERTLYYNYRTQFDRVSPYLGRMLVEAPESAGESWARLSALASLEGLITEDELVERLEEHDLEGMWKGAATVYAANLGNQTVGGASRSGLLRLLHRSPIPPGVLSSINQRLREEQVSADVGREVAEAFIAAIPDGTKYHELNGFIKWLSMAVGRDPIVWLEAMEQFAERLEAIGGNAGSIYGKHVLKALLEILREADESDEPELIRRAIALQDRFLRLGIHGMDEMLEQGYTGAV